MELKTKSDPLQVRLLYSKISELFQIPTLLIIVIFFICVGFIQYYFVQYQLYKNVENELQNAANKITYELTGANGWETENFRHSMNDYSNWHIIDTSGIIIDIEGFIPNIVGKITPPAEKVFQQPQTVTSAFRENWRVLARHLDSGYVILGIRQPSGQNNDDSLLYSNISIFGTSLQRALKVPMVKIDENIETAIISSHNNLLFMWGGIPLKSQILTSEYQTPHYQKLVTQKDVNYLFFKPVISLNNNKPIGVIIVYKNISDIQSALNNQFYVDLILFIIAIIFILILFAKSFKKYNPPNYTIVQAIAEGENEHIEFKETYIWNVNTKNKDSNLRFEVMKAIAGFSNKDGGQVFIGIKDDLKVPGIERDLQCFSSRDSFGLNIVDTISEYLGRSIMTGCYISYSEHNGKTVCIIKVPKSKEPVYFRYKEKQTFFLRIQNTTKDFEIGLAVKYINKHFRRIAS